MRSNECSAVLVSALSVRRVRDFDRTVLGQTLSGLIMNELAFLSMINSQSSVEQLRRWRPLLESYRMIGSYAQTELGHGNAKL